MITAAQLTTLMTYTPAALSQSIRLSGYDQPEFITGEFVGMTNSAQFCYSVTYREQGRLGRTKVFLSFDPTAGQVTADY